jgi:hypothetical protein
MTVNELIERLKGYPSDMRILTLGYEGGLNDISLGTNSVVFGYKGNEAWYYGPHEYARYVDGATGTPCLIVGRDK